ncbi:putative GPI biosynthesis protein Pig-F [Helianthus debilis subsp. tardiflorus]
MKKKNNKNKAQNFSPSKLLFLSHSVCGIGLASSFWLADSLIDYPVQTLCLLWVNLWAVVNALGAIALGAPVGSRYILRTLNWSLLMSAFTFAPAASVYGSSWVDWHRIFANTKLIESIDYMICIPAYGAVIGAWFGAWPMPLDWERTWQEWPICVTYGAIIGYLVGLLASFGFVVRERVKGD